MKRIFIIVIIIALISPISAYQPEEAVYSKIASVKFEKHHSIDNMTYFDLTIVGQIIKTVRSYVTITTPDSRLYLATINTNLDQETTGGFAPQVATLAVTDHTIRQGIQNYTVVIPIGISGNYDFLPNGNYTISFQIVGDFNHIPYFFVIQEGIIEYSQQITTFNPGEPRDSLPTSLWYLFFIFIIILYKIKSRRR